MKRLEQEGIFKVKPLSWDIREAESGAVAVSMSFKVEAELVDGKWESWSEYGDYMVYGDWWVVKKDGTINSGAVEQLAKSLGWNGNLGTVTGEPPAKIVQVSVKPDTYEGVTRYKGSWMNPEDYAGGAPGAADPVAVKGLQSRFGALLRAAAAGAIAETPKAPAAATKPDPTKEAKRGGPKGASGGSAPSPAAAGAKQPSEGCPEHGDFKNCPDTCNSVPF